ncbi:porin [Enterovibrio norvegicus]|uniref:porin n=1 Tax=Enterovibrio norvegicus TaxID=188144 RepID=UPI000C831B47|nr:porin [Enterovibrio norvegicus]PMI33055.1 porin [Enterovibrio norvegicus]TKF08909.1 porin [Enterovibrio norvegicus]TKF34500.1 porin [Enterovibrio norvegicus]
MKKTILAMAVPALLAAGAVNAATVYDQDGVTVTIGGAAEVQLYQGYEFGNADTKLDVRLDDGELNFAVDVEVSEGLTAMGYFDFDNDKTSVENDELWAGLKGDWGQATAGRQLTLWDDSGIGEDIELGLEGFPGTAPTDGEDVLKYRYDADAFWFGIAHDLDTGDDADHTDVGVGTSVAGLDLALYASSFNTSATVEGTAIQVSAVYNVDAFTVGASYTDYEQESNGTKVDADTGSRVELLAGYAVGDFQYYLGYNFAETDADWDGNNVYANATYKMHANVKTYVEVGYAEQDPEPTTGKSDDSTGFLVGLEVKF